MRQEVIFPSGNVGYYFNCSVAAELEAYQDAVILTDENVFNLHGSLFEGWRVIIIPAGEGSKTPEQVSRICSELLALEATRHTTLVGMGGGVVTDIAGFVAAVYMRGIRCSLVPTTLLAMVDAAIGGKNGVNLGLHKNMIGTIRQPQSILFDMSLLSTLPDEEWQNGFAEVIKYACVFDVALFNELAGHNIEFYHTHTAELNDLIRRCVAWKNKTVIADELETGQRRLLNFGHTAGHAIETLCGLPHGYAVSVGMMIAACMSPANQGDHATLTSSLGAMLRQYGLPISAHYNVKEVMTLLRTDKKRAGDKINFILLEAIGQAAVTVVDFETIERALNTYENNS